MSDSQTTNGLDKVNAVLDALTSLKPFDYDANESGIQDLIGVDTNQWSNVCSSEMYGETPSLGSIQNVVQRFKVQTIALGVSRNSQYGFANTVFMNGFQDRLNTTSAAIVVPVYRRHLEQNVVTYELVGKPDGWSVQGSPVANNTDGEMMANIISTNIKDGSSVPSGGLQLRITGRVNSKAGTVTFRMLEGVVSRPGVDGIPAGDYYTSFDLTKSKARH